jgi:ribonuclease III
MILRPNNDLPRMESLESRIGYKFTNPLLLAEALTHPSLAYETQGPHFDNQRLEFLGDAVLQLILTRELFLTFHQLDEGTLTKLRSTLVSKPALCRYAQHIELGTYLLMGKGEAASGGRERASTLADALEALIGAIYLDEGLSAATSFVLRQCEGELRSLNTDPDLLNPKGQLQELLQSVGHASPIYRIVSQNGPDHCKSFVASVEWRGQALAEGMGHSKKLAESDAAKLALDHPLVVGFRLQRETKSSHSGDSPERLSQPSKLPE